MNSNKLNGTIEIPIYIEEESPGHHPSTKYAIWDAIEFKTQFADVIIGKSSIYGDVLFLDKQLQSTSSDEAIYHEHLVHPLMNTLNNKLHKNILVIGGGEGATVREVLKWSSNNAIDKIDWVDIDGELVHACCKLLNWNQHVAINNPCVTYYAEDIFAFLKKTTICYDAIIIDLPDPEDSDDELYGLTFWKLIKEHLNVGGGISSHIGPVLPGNQEDKLRQGMHIIKNNLKKADLPEGVYYHTFIPSFQGEWGYWMSVPPVLNNSFPSELKIINTKTQTYAFTWPDYWFVPSFY